VPASVIGFSGVKDLLDEAIGGPNQGIGFHGPFWRSQTKDQFTGYTYRQVQLIVVGDPDKSGLIQALEGKFPFGKNNATPVPNARFNRMPDNKPYMPVDKIKLIRDWIAARCPA